MNGPRANRLDAGRRPVLAPPCIRQRPLGIAGPWQAVARLVFAPHRAAFVRSPGRLPFLRHPRRGVPGSSGILTISSRYGESPPDLTDGALWEIWVKVLHHPSVRSLLGEAADHGVALAREVAGIEL